MTRERFMLRHLASGRAWSDDAGPVVFASASEALAVALRFMCEPDAFAVTASVGVDDLLSEAS